MSSDDVDTKLQIEAGKRYWYVWARRWAAESAECVGVTASHVLFRVNWRDKESRLVERSKVICEVREPARPKVASWWKRAAAGFRRIVWP